MRKRKQNRRDLSGSNSALLRKKRIETRRRKKNRQIILLVLGILTLSVAGTGVVQSFASKSNRVPEKKQIVKLEEEKKVDKKIDNIEKPIEKKETKKVETKKIEKEKPVEDKKEVILSSSVPESEAVDISYFDDAMFLGNSRTETFLLFTGLSNATSYAYKGFAIDKVFKKPAVNINGQNLTVIDAIKHTNFSKAYIMFGYNETGWPYPKVFIEKYASIIDEIREVNPDAVIYIQSILPVSKKASAKNGDENNDNINKLNELIKKMALDKNVHFLNVREAVEDKDGTLPEEAASDGIHLKKEWAEKWLDYLKTHTVNN